MTIAPGARVAWVRGPSLVLVLGVIEKESDISPAKWASRSIADKAEYERKAVKQRIWACIEERTLDGYSAPGAKWNVPECDVMERP